MIVDLEKIGKYYALNGNKWNNSICTRFARKHIGSTKGVDKIKVYFRKKNPKDSGFTKATFDGDNLVINGRKIEITHYLYVELDTLLGNYFYNTISIFWFKIEPSR